MKKMEMSTTNGMTVNCNISMPLRTRLLAKRYNLNISELARNAIHEEIEFMELSNEFKEK